MTPAWVESTGRSRVAVYDFGGEGPALLFAHATGFHAHLWLPVVDHLRDAFHCYAFDARGHGASPSPPDGDFDWQRFADDALAAGAGLGLSRPAAVGHSMGGAALLLAEEARPGSWSSLWLYEPVVFPPVEGPFRNPLAPQARRRKAWFPSRAAAVDNFSGKPPFDAFTPDALRLYVEHGFVDAPDGGVTLACRPDDEAATYEHAAAAGLWTALPTVTAPVHGVRGEGSDHPPAQILPSVVDRLPRATLETMTGLGHFGPFEDPARVAASIRASLS